MLLHKENEQVTKYMKENIENLTYVAPTKKNRDTRTFSKKQPAILFHAARNTLHKHTHTHKKNNEKLVLICLPLLYPQPPGPKLWTFPVGCLFHVARDYLGMRRKCAQ